MKIGIFGGSFNPIHLAHKKIILELLDRHYVDKMIVVPTGDEYNKKDLISAKDRMEMAKCSLEGIKNVEVSNYEVRNGKKYTYETLLHFKKKYEDDVIYFILGEDNLEEFDTWKNYEALLENYRFLVIRRRGYDEETFLKKTKLRLDNVLFTDIVVEGVSSTKIRKKLKEGKEVTEVDSLALDYIQKNKLYK